MTTAFGHWFSRRALHLFLSEQAALVAALLAAGTAVTVPARSEPVTMLARAALGALVFQAALYALDLYDTRTARLDCAGGARVLAALGLALWALALLAVGLPRISLPAGGVAAGAAVAAAAVIGVRAAFGREGPRRVLILGTGDRARWIGRALQDDLAGDYLLAGYLDDGLSQGTQMAQCCERMGASVLVVASQERRGVTPVGALLECRAKGIEVIEAWVFAEHALRRVVVDQVRPGELALAGGWHRLAAHGAAKRALDIAVAAAIIALALPVLACAALVVMLTSPGPVFYRQERMGRRGRIYEVVKLRTMRADAEVTSGPTWAGAHDPRVTPVGRWLRKSRIDEIPQLWNVLRGDMSMVGPRPERPYFVEQLRKMLPYYDLRHSVRPGVTGWAQIRYPYGASIGDARTKLELDLYYLKNGSVWLDLVVIFHTAKTVLLARGSR